MDNLIELSISTVTRLDILYGLIQARRANVVQTAAYIEAHRTELTAQRLAELQSHLDDMLASLDVMDADYASLVGTPCNDEPNHIHYNS